MLTPVLVTCGVLNILNVWNEFLMPLYLLNNSDNWPMTLSVYNFFGQYQSNWAFVSADVVLTILPVILIYIVAQLPPQLPGEFLATTAGAVVQAIDPLEAARQFLQQGFIDVKIVDELWPLLYAPIAVTIGILGVLFLYAAPRLGLEGGPTRSRRGAGSVA